MAGTSSALRRVDSTRTFPAEFRAAGGRRMPVSPGPQMGSDFSLKPRIKVMNEIPFFLYLLLVLRRTRRIGASSLIATRLWEFLRFLARAHFNGPRFVVSPIRPGSGFLVTANVPRRHAS